MSLEKLSAFALLQFLFAITPGPAVILTMAQAMLAGFGAGVRVALGVQVGNVFYLALSGLGVGLLLQAAPAAFHALKLAGAAWLAWTGLRAVLAARAQPAAMPDAVPAPARPFTAGLLGQLANPKSIIFFGALLPMFLAPDVPLPRQYATLAALCVVIELPVLASYAGLAALAGRRAASPRSLQWRRIASGLALVVVSVLLALVPLAGP
ncbi:MAG: LysE family translocator [Rhodanobacteraceae bacterium]|jgi:homoserine/homoserine lactone efflux protein|nr:LysE family translocator [Rhodanobacteraceae bacterium]